MRQPRAPSPWPSWDAASSTPTCRSSMPTTRACCAGWRPSRRCASMAADPSPWTSTSSACASRRRVCGCPCPTSPRSTTWRSEAIRAAGGARTATLRFTVTGGRDGAEPVAMVLVGALPADLDTLRAEGHRASSRCRWAPTRARAEDAPWLLDGVKSTSYAVNMAAHEEAERRGAGDAIFVAADGSVLEGPTTNVWWRRGHDPLHARARPGHPGRRHPSLGAPPRRRGRLPHRGGLVPAGRRWPRPTRPSRRRRSASSCPSCASTAAPLGSGGRAPAALALHAALRAAASRRLTRPRNHATHARRVGRVIACGCDPGLERCRSRPRSRGSAGAGIR